MAEDWDIKPCSGTCAACEREFDDTELFIARLVFGEDGYAREDFCEKCWAGAERQNGAEYSSWRGTYKAPAPPTPETLGKDTAESLLRKLIEEADKSKKSAVYVLAVMLERKKIFVERDTRTESDGARSIVYEHKETGEVFVIPDPGLRLNQLGAVQEQVVMLLGGQPRGVANVASDASEGEPAAEESSS